MLIFISSLFFFDIEIFWQSKPQNISQQLIKHKLESSELSLTNIQPSINTHIYSSNLLTNTTQFNELLSYYSKVSESNYPKSWIHLNEQLFCPIYYSQSLHPTQTIISNAGERLLKYLYDSQFLSNCDDPNHKFVIFDIGQTSGTGIGATFNGGILKYFARAIMSKRTFLINGKFKWSEGNEHCAEYIGMECYFLPPSNCNPNDILSKTDKSNVWRGDVPEHCTLGDESTKNKKWCTERIIYSNKRSSGWSPKNSNLNQWFNSHFKHKNLSIFTNFVQFKSVLQSFIFRLNPQVRNIVMQKVRNAFTKSLNFIHFDPYKSISFPIRASDKCHENKMGLNGEMECWTKEEIFYIIQSIHVLNKNIDTLIFTSEDFDFVDKLLQCIQHLKNCENTTKMNIFEHYLDFKWNIVINHDDTKPSIGNANFKVFKDRKDENFNFQNDIGIDLEHDVVVGAFSSFMLQMNSKYIVYTKSSSWLDNVWTMATGLNCESILWNQQLQLKFNGFGGNNNNIDQTVKNEFNRLKLEYNRPWFLPQYNHKYKFFNRFCFELKQYGTLNKKTKWKHLLYPPDLWDKIHALDLKPDIFFALFGIQIYDNGWNHYCDRYTKLPWDTNEDVGV